MVKSHELRLVGLEAIEKSGDLFAIIGRRDIVCDSRVRPVVDNSRSKGFEFTNEMAYGDAPRDDRQIAREARSPSERTEDGSVILQTLECDVRDDVFSLGI